VSEVRVTEVRVRASRWKVWLPWAVLAGIVIVALVSVTVRSRPSNSPSARAARLTSELRCPSCESEAVSASQSAAAIAIKDDIKQRIAAGQSDNEIKAAEVAHYTEWVLLSPPSHGIGLIVWGLPVLALILGAGGLALAMRRWSRQPRLAASAADEELVARARSDE
jgi:cytochrome c-type biogenesis protein CcmH